MRAFVYYISLSFFLLCGGNTLYANTSYGSANFSLFQLQDNHQQLKHVDLTHHTVVIESSDIDFDEEFHTDDDYNGGNSNTVLAKNTGLPKNWYIVFADQYLFKTISTNNNFFEPFSGQSDPIYLKIGVLRI